MNQDNDQPLNGAEEIGRTARILDENGDVDLGRTYYRLAKGLLDADKLGGTWVSSRNRILRPYVSGKASTTPE
jgi:hypothetical protein